MAHGHIPSALPQLHPRRHRRPRRLAYRHPWHDAHAIGNLLGTRAVLNEFIAFTQLGAQKAALAPRTFSIATFALCGFANLGSIGMQIGGIGALIPARRNDLARLGLRAMLAGTVAKPHVRLHRQPAPPLARPLQERRPFLAQSPRTAATCVPASPAASLL